MREQSKVLPLHCKSQVSLEQPRRLPQPRGRLSVVNTDKKTWLSFDANNVTSLADFVKEKKVCSSSTELAAVTPI
jgi:hypothetical protein